MHLTGTWTLKSYNISQQLRSMSTIGPWIRRLSLVGLNLLGSTIAWVLALIFTSGVIPTKTSRCPSSKPILMNAVILPVIALYVIFVFPEYGQQLLFALGTLSYLTHKNHIRYPQGAIPKMMCTAYHHILRL